MFIKCSSNIQHVASNPWFLLNTKIQFVFLPYVRSTHQSRPIQFCCDITCASNRQQQQNVVYILNKQHNSHRITCCQYNQPIQYNLIFIAKKCRRIFWNKGSFPRIAEILCQKYFRFFEFLYTKQQGVGTGGGHGGTCSPNILKRMKSALCIRKNIQSNSMYIIFEDAFPYPKVLPILYPKVKLRLHTAINQAGFVSW